MTQTAIKQAKSDINIIATLLLLFLVLLIGSDFVHHYWQNYLQRLHLSVSPALLLQ